MIHGARYMGGQPQIWKCKGMRAILEDGEEVLKGEPAGELLDAAMIGAAQRIETMRLPGMSGRGFMPVC